MDVEAKDSEVVHCEQHLADNSSRQHSLEQDQNYRSNRLAHGGAIQEKAHLFQGKNDFGSP